MYMISVTRNSCTRDICYNHDQLSFRLSHGVASRVKGKLIITATFHPVIINPKLDFLVPVRGTCKGRHRNPAVLLFPPFFSL